MASSQPAPIDLDDGAAPALTAVGDNANVKVLTFNDALVALSSRGIDPNDEAEGIVQVIGAETLSLIDRVLLRRLRVPCRGDKCSHAECFDLEAYCHGMAQTGDADPRCPVFVLPPCYVQLMEEHRCRRC